MSSIVLFFRRLILRSRTVVGFGLIIVSIVGVFFVVRASAPGNVVIRATEFLPAGTVITSDMVSDGRVNWTPTGASTARSTVVGRVVGTDIAEGDIVTTRALEERETDRVEVSVPLGVTPPSSMKRGSAITLWSIDKDGVAPPVSVGRNVTVVSVTESGFGGDTVATVRVPALDIDRVLAVLGTSHLLVATSGDAP